MAGVDGIGTVLTELAGQGVMPFVEDGCTGGNVDDGFAVRLETSESRVSEVDM